jgi:hypothetical protein
MPQGFLAFPASLNPHCGVSAVDFAFFGVRGLLPFLRSQSTRRPVILRPGFWGRTISTHPLATTFPLAPDRFLPFDIRYLLSDILFPITFHFHRSSYCS